MNANNNFDPARDDYYTALACLHNGKVRDWFIANLILFDFESYSFQSAEEVYQEVIKRSKFNTYTAQLNVIYQRKLALKPGTKAPDFKLKGEDGPYKLLSDFKGKIVNLDF